MFFILGTDNENESKCDLTTIEPPTTISSNSTWMEDLESYSEIDLCTSGIGPEDEFKFRVGILSLQIRFYIYLIC